MPTYVYKARDAEGNLIKGSMKAADKKEVIAALQKTGCVPTQVSEATYGFAIATWWKKISRVQKREVILFYVKLANLLGAGINILASLNVLAKQVEHRKFKEVVRQIARSVEEGRSLSESFERYPDIFSPLFINMVRTGEATGNLEEILLRFANFSERQGELEQKIKNTLVYPIILLVAGLVITLFLVTFVMPKIAAMFVTAGIRLPLITLVFYRVGTTIRDSWFPLVAAGAAIAIGIRFYLGTEQGGYIFDSAKLRLPVMGRIYRNILVTRFTNTLGTLVESGVPILKSLNITRDVLGNRVMARKIVQMREVVEKGGGIAQTVQEIQEFPPDVGEMVAIGEESGRFAEILTKVADFYDIYVEYGIKQVTTIIEPMFILVLGGVVGLIMAAMLLPIFEMTKLVGF